MREPDLIWRNTLSKIAGMRQLLLTLFLLSLTGCGLSSRLLIPREAWLVEPDELGFAFEDIELESGPHTSVHGWFLPSAKSDGRTIVFCHGNAANISFYHPYYSFLHEAGYHVFMFDYRGYGQSRGKVSTDAIFTDTELALAYVMERPDVDPKRVVLYGTSLGAVVAMRTAARHPELAGVVIEDASSPRSLLNRNLGSFLASIAAVLTLPSSIEPVGNAAHIECPALFLCGEWDPALREHLATAEALKGPVANWVQPETAHAPSGLLEHDVEYQASVARFLDACVDGRCPRIEVRVASEKEVELTRRDFPSGERLAVQLCLVDALGQARFSEHWLTADSLRVPVEEPFRYATAWAYTQVESPEDSAKWKRQRGPMALSADAVQSLMSVAFIVQDSIAPVPDALVFVDSLSSFEQASGPLVPQAETELIPAFLLVGETLAWSERPSEREVGTRLLERCLAAMPPIPGAHYWPGTPYQAGFRFTTEVERARVLLGR